MDKKAEILLKHFRESKSQRDISKEVDVSRTTVAKYILGVKPASSNIIVIIGIAPLKSFSFVN